jgi:hypothetical protein
MLELSRALSLDFVNSCTHDPKVGGSNPPPRNQRQGKKEALLTAASAAFYFANFRAGRSAICTTLLLAERSDSIMASP